MVNDLHIREEGLRFESSQRLEQVRSEVVLWERSLDRAASVLTALVRLGLDERLVGVKEKTAENIAASLAAALAKAGINQEAANVVRREFSRKLRIIEAAESPVSRPLRGCASRPSPVVPGDAVPGT